VSGGSLPSIIHAIKDREARRARLQADLAALEQLQEVAGIDLGRLQRDLWTKLADWRGLLSRNVGDARQALRALVPERLTFNVKEDKGERYYLFQGTAVLDRLLSGIALPKALVAPTGFGIQTCFGLPAS